MSVYHKKIIRLGVLYLGAAILSIFSLLPIVWMVSTSFKVPSNIFSIPPTWVPHVFTLQNYFNIISEAKYFINSLIVATSSSVIVLLLAILAGYGLARTRFGRMSAVVSVAILFGQMIPLTALLVSFFVVMRSLGLLHTLWGLILIHIAINLPVSVWLLKGFFQRTPIELEDAALIDGCSLLGTLWRIIVPISMPGILAAFLYAFLASWNEFPLALVLTDVDTRTLPVALAYFIEEFRTDWGGLMSTAVVITIPAMVIFTLTQKHFVAGIAKGALKG